MKNLRTIPFPFMWHGELPTYGSGGLVPPSETEAKKQKVNQRTDERGCITWEVPRGFPGEWLVSWRILNGLIITDNHA